MLGGVLVLKLASARLAHASQRNTVIAQNVAHADTPGYKAQDVEPFDFERMVTATGSARPKATRSGHAIGQSPPGRPEAGVREVATAEPSPNGNTVSLEEQMVQAAEARGHFELAATLYAKHLTLLRIAIGRDTR